MNRYFCADMCVVLQASRIKQAAVEAGFDLCGICRVRNFDAEKKFFEGWLERGCDAGLEYLRRNVDKRFSPAALMPGARAVVMCGVVYKNDTSLGYGTAQGVPKVASYARSADYHTSIKEMLYDAAARLGLREEGVRFRAFVDTAPLLEKRLAVEAGLGFIGRNTLLVSPVAGSFLLLGELVVDAEADVYDAPYQGPGCGACRRCVERCPAGALTEAGLDARRCISRLTVEPHPEQVPALKDRSAVCTAGWIFGCDECQSVCPYNVKAPCFVNPRFAPLFHPGELAAGEWLAMTGEEFGARFGATPMARSGLERIKELLKR